VVNENVTFKSVFPSVKLTHHVYVLPYSNGDEISQCIVPLDESILLLLSPLPTAIDQFIRSPSVSLINTDTFWIFIDTLFSLLVGSRFEVVGAPGISSGNIVMKVPIS